MEQIKDYEIIPLGHAKNYEGKNIGDYKVLYRTNAPSGRPIQHSYWLCQCKLCNNYFIIKATTLANNICKCKCRDDLTNQRFGRWIVLYKSDKKTKNRSNIWHCKCDCGNEKDIDAYTLTSGQSKSCGCFQKEIAAQNGGKNKIDLTGQRYGKLVALYPIYSKDHNKHTIWHCKCDCGNECDIDMGNLRSGKSQSCGCTQSKQEENIIKLLTKNNIPFQYQYRFSDFATKRFDFYINNQYIIEFDGQQHFNYVNSGWNTKEHFERIRKSDLEKNQYCFQNNIPLIRIPYDIEYNLLDLQLETTRFLLTPKNEGAYYDR